MKKAICLILLAMILGAGALPSFAQYRKPVSEMSDRELQALIREQRDKFEMYTRRTRAALSSFIGQDISLGKDGMALLNRYYPRTVANIKEVVNRASLDPMNMIKSAKAGGKPGEVLDFVKDAGITLWAMVTFIDEMGENATEQDLFDIFRDQEQYPNDMIEAWAEQIHDQAFQDAADFIRTTGHSQPDSSRNAWYTAAALIDFYVFLEGVVEHERRKELRGYFWPRIPQGGPARGAPTGQPGPQGWILGRPGGNGAGGREIITVTGGGCVTVTYDENNNPVFIIEPCK